MKNLKKILAAVLVLAALVTAVVITALAADDDTYTGTVNEAVGMLNNVDLETTAVAKSTAMIALYDYIATVDPGEMGYAELCTSFSAKTLTVAQGLLAEADAVDGGTLDERRAALVTLYAHISAAPVFPDAAEEIVLARWEVMCGTYSDKTLVLSNILLANVKANKTADNIKDLYKYLMAAPVADDTLDGYDVLIDEYNFLTLEILSAALTSASEDSLGFAAVAELYKSAPVITDYETAEVAEKHEKFQIAYDTKAIKVATDMLGAVNLEGDKNANSVALGNIYVFIKNVSLFDEESDKAAELTLNINKKSLALAEQFYSDVAAVAGSAASQEPAPFKKAVEELLAFVKNCPSLIYRNPVVSDSFTGELAAANALLAAVNSATGDEKLTKFSALYEYMNKTPVDPSIEGAAELYSGYKTASAAVSDYIIDAAEALNSAPKLAGSDAIDMTAFAAELKKLKTVSSFLVKTPVSLDAINTYNGVLSGFTATLKNKFDFEFEAFTTVKTKLDAHLTLCPIDEALFRNDEAYTAFVAKLQTVNNYVTVKSVTDFIYSDAEGAVSVETHRASLASAINNLMVAALLDYEELTKPGDAVGTGSLTFVQSELVDLNDAETLEEKKELYAKLYKYLRENPINPRLDGYDLFAADFALVGEEVYKYIIDNIKTVDDMEAAEAYFTATPVSEDAITAYNNKYLFIYRDALKAALAEYEVGTEALHEFLGADGVSDAVSSVEGLNAAIDNYEILELTALAQIYNLSYLDDDIENGVVALIVRGNAQRKLEYYNRAYPIDDSSIGAALVNQEVQAALADYDKVLQETKESIDSKTPFEEYEYGFYKLYDWEGSKSELDFTWSENALSTNKHEGTGTRHDIIPNEKLGGNCWKLTYGDQGQWSGAFFGRTQLDSTNGLVFEFDLMGEEGIDYFRVGRIEYPTRANCGFFYISKNKIYPIVDCVNQTTPLIEEDVTFPGEWTHFVVAFSMADQTITLYADYQLLGTWSVLAPDYTIFSEIRITSGVNKNTSFCIDNLEFYGGSHYRIRDKFEKMDDGEKFRYFVDYMCNEEYESIARLSAYQNAGKLLSQFAEDPEFADYIEKFNSVDVDEAIIKPAKDANLEKLSENMKPLQDYVDNPALITTENSASVQTLITAVDIFIEENSAYLDLSNPDFVSINANLNSLKVQISRCETVISFVDALNKFDRAFTYAAKMRHYEKAFAEYEAGQFREEEIRALVAGDPAILSFEAMLNGDVTSDKPDYVDVFEYFDLAEKILADQATYENSGKIIDCLEFITKMEGFEPTDEFLEANYAYISRYMNIIRDIVTSGNYVPEYEGVKEAIELFREMDVYFYEVLQNEHIAYLSEIIAKYPAASSYIERLGICTSVEKYLAENDIDYENAELAKLVVTYEAYAAELVIFKEEYAGILKQNTAFFIDISERLTAYVNYAELKALYDEGMKYYYEMNVDSEEAVAAIAIFEDYGKKLAAIEEASVMFAGYADELAAAKTAGDIYEALVSCSMYEELATDSIEGVAKARARYNTALADYNAKYQPRNVEISEANNIVCSVRANTIAEAILSVISKIFNK